MTANYEDRIQALEAKYGWTFNALKKATMSPIEIVEYAYMQRTAYFKTWGIYFLVGLFTLTLIIISLYKNYMPDIMGLFLALPIILMSQGVSYLITIRKVFNDLLKLAAEIESGLVKQ